MNITIKHLDAENVIILSMFSDKNNSLTNSLEMSGCKKIFEGQIMPTNMFYAECRKMQRVGQRVGCNGIERIEV